MMVAYSWLSYSARLRRVIFDKSKHHIPSPMSSGTLLHSLSLRLRTGLDPGLESKGVTKPNIVNVTSEGLKRVPDALRG